MIEERVARRGPPVPAWLTAESSPNVAVPERKGTRGEGCA